MYRILKKSGSSNLPPVAAHQAFDTMYESLSWIEANGTKGTEYEVVLIQETVTVSNKLTFEEKKNGTTKKDTTVQSGSCKRKCAFPGTRHECVCPQ